MSSYLQLKENCLGNLIFAPIKRQLEETQRICFVRYNRSLLLCWVTTLFHMTSIQETIA